MRKYQPVWEAIKKEGTATILTPISTQERIIKAVRKEKAMDIGWKLLLSESGKRYKLKETVDGKLITFTLEVDTYNYIADMKL